MIATPWLLRRGKPTRFQRVQQAAAAARGAMLQVRPGCEVFRRPKLGGWAALMQLTAWAIQWLACYVLLVALGLDEHAGIGAAAAVLFAVNVTAALPATPSNLGVFQAACVAVLSAYGVGKTDAFAYGIILQAVEIATAVAMGMPALVREGMTWKDLRLRALHASPVQLRGRARRGEAPPKLRPKKARQAGRVGPRHATHFPFRAPRRARLLVPLTAGASKRATNDAQLRRLYERGAPDARRGRPSAAPAGGSWRSTARSASPPCARPTRTS